MADIGKIQVAQAVAQNAPAEATGNFAKDATEDTTAPQFGEVLKRMQAQYGAKAEKPREIKKSLGKDDFLRIMITQMQHQDPTSPFKAEQMAQEMAQFTSVEQMQNMSHSLEKMANKESPVERMAMTNLIGKTVTIDRGKIAHQDGANESLGYVLPRPAASVKIALISEKGETVLEKDLGAQKQGENSFSWDGLQSNTLPAKAGNYMFRVEAKDDLGRTIDTGAQAKARVVGISFEGSEPVFLVGDAKNQARVTMKNIVRIDDNGGSPFSAPAAMGGGSGGIEAAAQSTKPNFIAFKKGEGSSSLDPSSLSPEAAAALAKYEASQAGAADAPKAPATVAQADTQAPVAAQAQSLKSAESSIGAGEKGFPSGLQE